MSMLKSKINHEVEIIITPKAKKTDDKYFNNQNQWVTIEPFKSNLNGLALCLQNANGLGKRVPIIDTEKSTKENISDFGYFWFEFSSCEKEYIMTVTID